MKNSLFVILVLLLISLSGCGSRKSSKSKIEELAKTEIDVKTEQSETSEKKENSTVITDSKTNIDFDVNELEENLIPIDPTKPMTRTEILDGNTKKTIWENSQVNNKSKTDKSKKVEEAKKEESNTIEEKKEISSSDQIKASKESAITKLNKESERKQGFPWWIIIVVSVFVIAYFIRKKILSKSLQ